MGIYKAQVSVKEAARCAEQTWHGTRKYNNLNLHTKIYILYSKYNKNDITEYLNKLQ